MKLLTTLIDLTSEQKLCPGEMRFCFQKDNCVEYCPVREHFQVHPVVLPKKRKYTGKMDC